MNPARKWWWLRTPWATAVLAVGIWTDGLTLPDHSQLGSLLRMRPSGRVAADSIYCHRVYFVLRDGALVEVEDGRSGQPDYFVIWKTMSGRANACFWAEAETRFDTHIDVLTMEGAVVTGVERDRVVTAFLGWFQRNEMPSAWGDVLFARGQGDHYVLHPWGSVHNCLALAVAGLLVYSLGWVWRGSEWRRERLLAQGKCPNCRYLLAGLKKQKCP